MLALLHSGPTSALCIVVNVTLRAPKMHLIRLPRIILHCTLICVHKRLMRRDKLYI